MSVKWSCSYCLNAADYHSCTNGVHRYYCDHHWWKYVNEGYVVRDMEVDDAVVDTFESSSKQSTQELHKVED